MLTNYQVTKRQNRIYFLAFDCCNTGVMTFFDIQKEVNHDGQTEKHRFGFAGVEKFLCFWLLVSLSAWPNRKEKGALQQPGHDRPLGKVEKRKNLYKNQE